MNDTLNWISKEGRWKSCIWAKGVKGKNAWKGEENHAVKTILEVALGYTLKALNNSLSPGSSTEPVQMLKTF